MKEKRLEALRSFAPKACECITDQILMGNGMQRLEFLCERGHGVPWKIRRWARRQRKVLKKAAAGDFKSQIAAKLLLSPSSSPAFTQFIIQYGNIAQFYDFLNFEERV